MIYDTSRTDTSASCCASRRGCVSHGCAWRAPGQPPAERAGIVVGDAIAAIAGKDVANAEALATALAGLQPGQTVDVAITRPDGTSATVKVKLGELAGS